MNKLSESYVQLFYSIQSEILTSGSIDDHITNQELEQMLYVNILFTLQ